MFAVVYLRRLLHQAPRSVCSLSQLTLPPLPPIILSSFADIWLVLGYTPRWLYENKVSCSRTQHNDLVRAIFVFSFRSEWTDRRPRILISYISFSHSNRHMDDDEKQKRLAAMMDNAKYVLFNPLFNSQKWPRQSFSLQYQYSIKHISDENKKRYQSSDY